MVKEIIIIEIAGLILIYGILVVSYMIYLNIKYPFGRNFEGQTSEFFRNIIGSTKEKRIDTALNFFVLSIVYSILWFMILRDPKPADTPISMLFFTFIGVFLFDVHLFSHTALLINKLYKRKEVENL